MKTQPSIVTPVNHLISYINGGFHDSSVRLDATMPNKKHLSLLTASSSVFILSNLVANNYFVSYL